MGYEEAQIELAQDGAPKLVLNLYDPQLFKPVVPAQFRAAEGECDTNYFNVSTLYYERRACTYDIEMIKYGTDYSPLAEPTREDCLFRLGCCYEDNEEVMAKYPFMPRCYQRVKNDRLENRIFQSKPVEIADVAVCGNVAITDFVSKTMSVRDILAGVDTRINSDDVCLYTQTTTRHNAQDCNDQDDCTFWQIFDIFDKERAKEYYKKYDGIPLELQGMVNDLF